MAELGHGVGLEELDDKDYDDAVGYLDQAYQVYPSSDTYRTDLARAYDLRGQRYLTLGELSKAIADFKQAHALDPTDASYDTNLSTSIIAAGSS